MSKLVKEAIDLLFNSTKDLRSFAEITPHCENFNETVKDVSKASLGTYLSRYKFYHQFRSLELIQGQNADVIDISGTKKLDHLCILLCGLQPKEWDDRNESDRVSNRLANGKEIIPDQYLDAAKKLLASDDPHELAVGLIAVSGRRPVEILARGDFQPIKGEKYQVMFSGQAKKRGEAVSFAIATLFPSSYVISRLKLLQEMNKDFVGQIVAEFPNDIELQNQKIQDRRGNSLRRVVARDFGDQFSVDPALAVRCDDESNNCKALRAAYLCLAVARDCHGSTGQKLLQAAMLAGHYVSGQNPSDSDLKNLITTIGYSDYFCNQPVPFAKDPSIREMASIKVYADDLEVVSSYQSEWQMSSHAAVVGRLLGSSQQASILEKSLGKSKVENQKLLNKISELQTMLQDATKMVSRLSEENKDLSEKLATSEEMVQALEARPAAGSVDMDEIKGMFRRLELRLEALESKDVPPVPPVPAIQSAEVVTRRARDRNQSEFEMLENKDLWQSRKAGSADEKIRRSFEAVAEYNSSQSDPLLRVAPNTDVLRKVSGVNGGVVGLWLDSHADELMYQLDKFQMPYSRKSGKVYTVFNRGKNVDPIASEIREKLLG